MSKFETVLPASIRDRDDWIGTLTFTSRDFEAIYQDHGPDCKIMRVVEPNRIHYYARGKKADRLAASWFFLGCVQGVIR